MLPGRRSLENIAGIALLHSPLATASTWEGIAEAITARGGSAIVAEITDDERPPYAPRYIARAALEIGNARPTAPLLLVAEGAAGALLPQVGAAQRAAHRQVTGYVLLDALLPHPGTPTWRELAAAQLPFDPETAPAERARPTEFFTEALPMPQDWPDAPCTYVRTNPRYDHCAHLASLRSWPVVELEGSEPERIADVLLDAATR